MLYSFQASCLNASYYIKTNDYDRAEHYLKQAMGRANLVSKPSLPKLMTALNLVRSHKASIARIQARRLA